MDVRADDVPAQVWNFEGLKTLGHYLRRRDCIGALALDMGVPKNAVVPVVMRQIFEAASVSLSAWPSRKWHAQAVYA